MRKKLSSTETMLVKKYKWLCCARLHYKTQLSFVIALLLFFLNSCKKPDITFGSQFLNNDNTQVIYVDTITTEMSTVYLDSFRTNGKGAGVAGIYDDPYFGTTKAKCYLQIAPPAFKDTFSNSIFDSLILVLHLNKSYYGDTTKPLMLNVYRLAQNIKYASGTSYLYNNDSFSVYEPSLAQKTFMLWPNGNDSSINIRLPDALGSEWLSMLAESADEIETSDAFVNYFKGICIAASGPPAFAFGFKDSVNIRLHYKQKGVFLTDKHVDFSLNNNSYQFNNISIDRTGTALSNISSLNDEISSSLTSNAGYLQAITGTVVKLQFPYLRNLLQTSGYSQIVSAQLKIKPVKGSFTGIYPLPPSIILSSTDASNKSGTALTQSDGSTQTGSLQIDEIYGENTYYTYDVTDYLKSVIAVSTNNEYGLIVSPPTPQFETTFNRILIGDNKNAGAKTQLSLYYLAVQ